MGKVLTLTASARGRAATEGGGGFTLLVDGDDEVTVEVIPEPRVWLPQGVTLLRNGVALPRPSFGTTWRMAGPYRFGTYVARATEANGSVVESAPTTVVPALAAVPTGAGDAGRHAGRPGSGSAAGSGSSSAAGPASGSAAGPGSGSAAGSGAGARAAAVAAQPSPAEPTGPPPPPAASPPPSASPPPTDSPPPAPAAPDPLTTSRDGTDPAPAAPTVISIPVGEYDGRFSAWTAALFALLAGALLLIVAAEVLPHFNAMQSTAQAAVSSAADSAAAAEAASSEAAPLYARRLDAVLRLLITTVGILLLLAGAALAALETRARLQRTAALPVTITSEEAVPPDVLDKVPAILERASVLRGTTLVLLVGASMLVLAMCAPARSGAQAGADPSATPSASDSPAASPSVNVAPTTSASPGTTASPATTASPGATGSPAATATAEATGTPARTATAPSPTAAATATPTR